MTFKYTYKGEVFTSRNLPWLLNKILRADYDRALELYCKNLNPLEEEVFDPEEDNDLLWDGILHEMKLDEQIYKSDRVKWGLDNFVVKDFGVKVEVV